MSNLLQPETGLTTDQLRLAAHLKSFGEEFISKAVGPGTGYHYPEIEREVLENSGLIQLSTLFTLVSPEIGLSGGNFLLLMSSELPKQVATRIVDTLGEQGFIFCCAGAKDFFDTCPDLSLVGIATEDEFRPYISTADFDTFEPYYPNAPLSYIYQKSQQ